MSLIAFSGGHVCLGLRFIDLAQSSIRWTVLVSTGGLSSERRACFSNLVWNEFGVIRGIRATGPPCTLRQTPCGCRRSKTFAGYALTLALLSINIRRLCTNATLGIRLTGPLENVTVRT